MMRLIILSLFALQIFPCQYKDISKSSSADERKMMIDKTDDPGLRIALLGIKAHNSTYGTATVNTVINNYIDRLCKHLPNYEIIKTDFKGLYIRCPEGQSCLGNISEKVSKVQEARFPNSDQSLKTERVSANSYTDGHIKARIKSIYPDYQDPLEEFIDKKTTEVLEKHKDLFEKSDFESIIGKHIDKFRKEGIEAVPEKFHDIINLLDVAYDTPFASSSNIDELMGKALNATATTEIDGKKPNLVGDYLITSATSGDDKFIVIKKGPEVIKVIGADARGLGKENMLSRLREVIKFKKRNPTSTLSFKDILSISNEAMTNADKTMFNSLDLYEDSIISQIEQNPRQDIDVSIKLANEEYDKLANNDHSKMKMRTTILSDCGTDKDKIMNQVSALHKRQKIFEEYGRKVDIGASCIGLEFFLLNKGLKKVHDLIP